MKFRLTEEQIEYNANPWNRNEGDCAIRALSLAYDMNYNRVKSELNSIAGRNKSKFNYLDTIEQFIQKHHFEKVFDNEINSSSIDDVEDFARKNRHGVYVVYCSNKTKQNSSNSFHLVTIVDSKIYDTWDSSNYYVLKAWKIKGHNRTVNQINLENNN